MKDQTAELTAIKRNGNTYDFITGVIQHNRKRPAKYLHYLELPLWLYEEMNERGLIDMEAFYVDEQAFFEFSGQGVRVSFMTLYQCEDFWHRVDHYQIIKLTGSYPVKRGCSSSL